MKKIICLLMAILVISTLLVPTASAEYRPTFEVRAKAAILYNKDTDTVLYSKDADKKIYPASLTKIMVAVLLVENVPDLENQSVTISQEIYEQYRYSEAVTAGFDAGQEVNCYDLLAYTMVKSCADAAAAIAERVSGGEEEFIKLMNKKAKEIGMTSTNFTNCHGLHDDKHYSTVRDMCTLTKYAMKYAAITDVAKISRYLTKDEITLAATNLMIDPNTEYYYKYATGFKTGFTDEAGRCLASTATYLGSTYICVLVGCPAVENSIENRYEFIDSAELYRWAFTGFEYRQILDENEIVGTIPITQSLDADSINVKPQTGLSAIMPIEADDSTLKQKVIFKDNATELEAPIKKGDVLGTVEIYYSDQLLGKTNLVAASTVSASQTLKAVNGVSTFAKEYRDVIVFSLFAILILVIIFVFAIIRLNSKKKKYGRIRNYKRF